MITKAMKRARWIETYGETVHFYTWDEVCRICEDEFYFDCMTPAYEVFEYFTPVIICPVSY